MIWNVLYTKPRNEKKVHERLNKLGLESYCPIQKTLKQWSDRKKWVDEPVFKSYIFVKTPSSEIEKNAILNTQGAVRFLYWLGKPAEVKQAEIDSIKSFLGTHENVRTLSFDVGSELKVNRGPLSGTSGTVVYQTKNEVFLNVEKLGMSLVARLSLNNVEK